MIMTAHTVGVVPKAAISYVHLADDFQAIKAQMRYSCSRDTSMYQLSSSNSLQQRYVSKSVPVFLPW
jgi:hypothetical protein